MIRQNMMYSAVHLGEKRRPSKRDERHGRDLRQSGSLTDYKEESRVPRKQ